MSDPVAWGVGTMLALMGLADVIAVLGPIGVQALKAWLDAREKRKIGF